MLIVFGGLPGSGKSTVARALARQIKALYLRIDTIEQAIRSSAPLTGGQDVGPSGSTIRPHRVGFHAELSRLGA
jgi:predicted kinase